MGDLSGFISVIKITIERKYLGTF